MILHRLFDHIFMMNIHLYWQVKMSKNKDIVKSFSPIDFPPLCISKIEAGFMSPVEDYKEEKLDLNHYLISNPAASFFVRVIGDSMNNAGIYEGSLLLVDRSLEAVPGKIVIAALEGEFTVKRLLKKNDFWILHAENPAYKDIIISARSAFTIWGVVTAVINKV